MTQASLYTATSSGAQTFTQSPQNSTQANLANQSNVQSGTADDLLQSHSGILLHSTATPTVGLAATTSTSTAPNQAVQHGLNPVLFGLSALLFVVAIALFWTTSHTQLAKNTTKS